MYKTLRATAVEFIRAQDQDLSTPTRMNHERIRAIRSTSGFEHSWGHNYFASTKPALSSVLDIDGFIEHLNIMTPPLESWDTEITDVLVDEERKMAVVRASYYMCVKGEVDEEPVENDIVWFLTMEEDGKRVRKAMEFIDDVSAMKLGQRIQKTRTEKERMGS